MTTEMILEKEPTSPLLAEAHPTASTNYTVDVKRLRNAAERTITKQKLCSLATVSAAGWPHNAMIHYVPVGTTLYGNTRRSSRKAHNMAANPRVGVNIPMRRVPVAPPSAVFFQGNVELIAKDDPEIVRLIADGTLKSLVKIGELDLPDLVFFKITPARRINTYGLGMSLFQLARDPLHAMHGYDI